MPFKTRRQKIAAASRRFVFTDGKVGLADLPKEEVKVTEVRIETDSRDDKENLGYVKKDVLKTLAVAILIIAFQLIIFFHIH